MDNLPTYIGTCHEDAPKVIMGRIVGLAGTAITQASLTAISYLVTRYASKLNAESCTDGTAVVIETTLTVGSVIYNTLQTDNDWTADATGYNFKTTIAAASFPTKAQWYRIEVWCDPTSGDDFLGGVWILRCLPTARD